MMYMDKMRENEAAKRFMQPTLTRDQLLTVNDFNELKAQLLYEIRQLLKEVTGKPTKQWLKTHEVKKLLGISQSTLQTLRDNGTIPFTKLGGVIFYSVGEIQQMLDKKN
jgi:hypothetical protein